MLKLIDMKKAIKFLITMYALTVETNKYAVKNVGFYIENIAYLLVSTVRAYIVIKNFIAFFMSINFNIILLIILRCY